MYSFSFTVDTPLGPAPIEARIYPNAELLTAAARRYSPERPVPLLNGIVHRWSMMNLSDGVQFPEALVRLHEESLTMGIISHEAAHAALHIYETAWGHSPTCEDDEDFAYLLGDVARLLTLGTIPGANVND